MDKTRLIRDISNFIKKKIYMYQNKMLASFATSSVPAAKRVSDMLISNERKGFRFFANLR